MSKVVDLYTIQVIRNDDAIAILTEDKGIGSLPKMIAEAEENLNDLLPFGYYMRIKKWDDLEDEETQDE